MCQLARRGAKGVMAMECDRMTEHPAHESAVQMPQITRAHPFCLIALDQLAEDRLDPIPDAAQGAAARRIRILADFAKWGEEAHAISSQRLRQKWCPIVAITNQVAGGGPFAKSARMVRSEQPRVAIRSYPEPCTREATTCSKTTRSGIRRR
mgnify:CR=1 FL=1